MLIVLAIAASAIRLSRTPQPALARPPVRMSAAADGDDPAELAPGSIKGTLSRLRINFESGKTAGAAYISKLQPQPGVQGGNLSTSTVLLSALLAVLQVEAVQFSVAFCGAWLFGVGVPAAAVPATGVRLRTAAEMAVACRHPSRVARLLVEAWCVPAVLRGLQRAPSPREYVQDQVTQPLAVLATAVLTARALERTVLAQVAAAPALQLLGKCGLAEATELAGASVAARAADAWNGFARAEELALTLPASAFLIGLTGLDARFFALLASAWDVARPWVVRVHTLLFS